MKCCWSEISEYVKVRLYDSQNNKVLKCFLSSLLGLLPLLNNHQQNMLHIHSYHGMISLPCLLMVMAYFLSTLSQINVNLALANLVSRRVLRGPTLFNWDPFLQGSFTLCAFIYYFSYPETLCPSSCLYTHVRCDLPLLYLVVAQPLSFLPYLMTLSLLQEKVIQHSLRRSNFHCSHPRSSLHS